MRIHPIFCRFFIATSATPTHVMCCDPFCANFRSQVWWPSLILLGVFHGEVEKQPLSISGRT